MYEIIREFVYITILRTAAVYYKRFYNVLGHFPKASRAKRLLVTKATFLRNEPQI